MASFNTCDNYSNVLQKQTLDLTSKSDWFIQVFSCLNNCKNVLTYQYITL